MSHKTRIIGSQDKKLNIRIDQQLTDYARSHVNIALDTEPLANLDINEMVRDFGEFVRILISMKSPLLAMEPSP